MEFGSSLISTAAAFITLLAAFLWHISLFVHQQTVAVIEVFERFYAIKNSGLHFILPFGIALVVGYLNLRLQELKSSIEVKTLDNVFVEIPVSLLIPSP